MLLDNDCDGVTDEDDASDALLWYADLDGDGYGDASVTVSSCSQPDGHVATSGDCDDSASAVNPGVEESCDNSVDDDCDASTDEGCSGPGTDDDGDGYTEDDGDCDDMDPDRSPGATETCFDDVDQDCSGAADDACMHVYTTSISMAPDAGTSTYYVDYPTEADETLAFLAVGSLIEYGDEQCDFQTDITDEGGRYRVEITLQHCGYGVYSSYGFQAQAVVFARVGGAGGFTAFDLESVGNLTDDGSATITDGDGTASTTLCAVYSGDAGGDVDAQWLCRANVEGDSLVGLLSQEYGNSASLAGARIMNIGLGENLEATAMPFSCGIEGDETYTHTVSEALGTDHLAIPVLTDWLTGTSDSTSMESDCDLVDDEYSCEIRCYGSGGSVGGTILFIDGSFQ